MSNTNALTNEVNAGSLPAMPQMAAMKPWDIAELPLYHSPNGQMVDVEHATDAQFDTWRIANGIPAKPGAWNFERRCKALNMCRFYGYWSALKFPLELCADTEQKCADVEAGEQNSSESAPNSSEASQEVSK